MPTYDFECEDGHEFEVFGCQVGTEEWACRHPGCRHFAKKVYRPGAWTNDVGIMEEQYVPAIGKSVGSRRKLDQEMKAIGAVPKGTTTRRSPPTINDMAIEDAKRSIRDSRVTEIKEWRQKADYEERHGRKAPPPP